DPNAWAGYPDSLSTNLVLSFQLVFWGIVLLHQLFWLDSLLGGRLSAALLQWIG
ncbi:hypothetical protein ACLBWA_33695, partial [Pseudomonas aeruginosa]